jgi:hypothetical protein
MTDLTLTADEALATPEMPSRQVRMVSSGLAPTADVPVSSRTKRESPPCYAPCTVCGALVLTGATQTGIRLALDVGIKTYVVDWHHGTPQPVLIESRGYPVHRCGREETPAP